MNKLFNYIALAGIVIMAISCATPELPSPTNMAIGNWIVDEFFVNGQSDGSSTTSLERFTLERDNSFVLEDDNGIIYVGTWTATADRLTLTESGDGGTVFDFEIVYQSYTKMQLLQTISSPTAGDITIRYLMNWQNNGSNY